MADRPNILLICSDQHTARVTGAYGDSIIDTPHLDALAAEGGRFDACYCNSPICGPSRASFLTGRYPFRTEALGNQDVYDSRIPTLGHVAMRGGYHCVLAGKMHFVGPDQHHGFAERPVGEMGSLAAFGVRRPEENDDGLPTNALGNCSRPEPLQYTGAGGNALIDYDADITAKSIDWLENYAGRDDDVPPFFLTVGYLLPHCPFIAPRDVYDKYPDRVKAPRL